MNKIIKKVSCVLLCLMLTGCQNTKNTDNAGSNSDTAIEDTIEDTTEDTTEEVTTLAVDKNVTQITGDYSDNALNAEWSLSDACSISLADEEIKIDGNGAAAEKSKVTITKPGTYVLSGSLSDGQIIVNLTEDENVQIVLNGVDISCSNQAPIVILSAKNTYLTLAEGTENKVSDGTEYTFEENQDEPDAAIFSKDDLIINGSGSLSVQANYKDGIKSKDDLQIIEGVIEVNAKEDGITGKDSVSIRSGEITIVSGKDGIKSSEDTDVEKGFIVIDGGTFHITSGNDGIQAVTLLSVNDGNFDITTNEGSANASFTEKDSFNKGWGKNGGGHPDGEKPANGDKPANGERPEREEKPTDGVMLDEETASISAKALKSDYNIGIFGGTFQIDSSDDAVHSNQTLLVNAGDFTISSGDDGLHADTNLEINNGKISISKSYEGLESDNITINGGEIDLVAADDGVNVSGGSDGSSEGGRPGQNQTASSSQGALTITGGTLKVDASGDGLDSNGSIVMTSGYVEVSGPTSNGDGILDYDTTFDISGGVLLGAGSDGMSQTTSKDSKQKTITAVFDNKVEAGTKVDVANKAGEIIYSFTPAKEYTMVIVSAKEITESETYTFTAGNQTKETK